MTILNMRRREARDRYEVDDVKATERLGNLMGFTDQATTLGDLVGTAAPAGEPEPEPEPDEPHPEPEPDDTHGVEDERLVPQQRAVSADVAALMTAIVVTPAVVPDADSLVARAQACTITTEAEWTAAIDLFDLLRQVEQQIGRYFDEDCATAHKLWKSLTDKRGAQLKPVEAARKALGDLAAEWRAADDRRKADEARRREQQLRDDQAAEANRQARALVRSGDMQAAREVIEEAKVAPRPVVQAAAPVTSTKAVQRNKWIAEIEDLPALLVKIGAGECPEFHAAIAEALLPLLNSQVTTLKTEIGKRYPGVVGRQKPSTAGR